MTNQEYLIGVMNDVEIIANVLERIVREQIKLSNQDLNVAAERGIMGEQLWVDVNNVSYYENEGILAWEYNIVQDGLTSHVRWHDSVMYGLGEFREIGDAEDDDLTPYRTEIMTEIAAELRSFDWASRLQILSIQFHIDEATI